MGDACFSTQLIDGDGVFNVSGLDNFMKEVKLGECGLLYAVVSIMGPQSSGMGFALFMFFFILFNGYFLLYVYIVTSNLFQGRVHF
jgi:hypothetical protein